MTMLIDGVEVSDACALKAAGESDASLSARRAKAIAAASRLRTLAMKAAKHAKDPGSNPALTAREINEFLARLALAEAADDQ